MHDVCFFLEESLVRIPKFLVGNSVILTSRLLLLLSLLFICAVHCIFVFVGMMV